MRPLGLLLFALALSVPLVWFWPLAAAKDPIAVFSHYLGSAALIAMGLSQLMATRLPGLETLFGGLDRIYVLHKWIGVGAMTAILLHDTIDAELDEERETFLTELGETFGEISLYGLLILVVITLVTFIPYHWWRWTHRFIGAFFVLSALHFFLIMKPFALGDPLGLYISAFCVVGIAAYLYTLAPARLRGPSQFYEVSAVEPTGAMTAVTLTPLGKGLRHRAGQFAFLGFERAGQREVHPFTISTAPRDDRSLRFSIARLGDGTNALSEALELGDRARVTGPFGHFTRRGAAGLEIWIAGGAGITPFLAWAEALTPEAGPVHLFYSVRRREAAAHLDALEQLARDKDNLTLHLIETARDGRLTAEAIAAAVEAPLKTARAAFCGPAEMRAALKAGLVARGLAPRRFRYEEFQIRSGIGLGEALLWLFDRLTARPRGRVRQ